MTIKQYYYFDGEKSRLCSIELGHEKVIPIERENIIVRQLDGFTYERIFSSINEAKDYLLLVFTEAAKENVEQIIAPWVVGEE